MGKIIFARFGFVVQNGSPFTIATNNFGAFEPRTIFIQPTLQEDTETSSAQVLKKLKQAVDAFCNTHAHYGAKPDGRPFHPHITIATRDLHKAAFAEAWAYFEGKKYAALFEAKGLGVLRHNSIRWDVIHISVFSA